MPGNDQTGPEGMGPMTGKSFGSCSKKPNTRNGNRNIKRRNKGRGGGGNRQRGIRGVFPVEEDLKSNDEPSTDASKPSSS